MTTARPAPPAGGGGEMRQAAVAAAPASRLSSRASLAAAGCARPRWLGCIILKRRRAGEDRRAGGGAEGLRPLSGLPLPHARQSERPPPPPRPAPAAAAVCLSIAHCRAAGNAAGRAARRHRPITPRRARARPGPARPLPARSIDREPMQFERPYAPARARPPWWRCCWGGKQEQDARGAGRSAALFVHPRARRAGVPTQATRTLAPAGAAAMPRRGGGRRAGAERAQKEEAGRSGARWLLVRVVQRATALGTAALRLEWCAARGGGR